MFNSRLTLTEMVSITCMDTQHFCLFIYQLIYPFISCFHFLATMSNVIRDIFVQVYLECIPKSGTVAS